MRRNSLGLLSILLVACGGGIAPEQTPQPAGGDGGVDAAPTVAQTAALTSVDIYQVVQIPLMKDGARVENRNAPLIADRAALLRVAIKPNAGWKRKKLDAILTVKNAAGSVDKKTTREIGPSGSTTGALDTTFNFDLEKEQITKDATWSVVVKNGDEVLARFPEEGDDVLGAVASAKLKVKLVPVKWGADGSGRVPDVGTEMVEVYRQTLTAMYPVLDTEISVREPYEWKESVTAEGDGWDTLLNAIVDLRNTEAPAADVYYYGVFNPNDSFWKYCEKGCVAGLSGLLRDPTDAFGRGSIGLGFSSEESAATMAHEIGHAHGRPHAPCGGAAGVDRKYPYSEGEIGVYGYSQADKKLIDPTFSDIMGYCYPKWISDYTYNALFTRISYVSKPKQMVQLSDAPIRYRFINIDRAGKLRWGRTTITRSAPTSDPTTVTYEAADGTRQSVTGHYYPYGEGSGGYLVVPEPTLPAVTVAITPLPGAVETKLTIPR